MQNKIYAGIGSRETPIEMQSIMKSISRRLFSMGYVLRSGAADGADSAFESGIPCNIGKEIFIPWEGFSDRSIAEDGVYIGTKEQINSAMVLAEQYHPKWDSLSSGAKKLMARNCFQVLGLDLQTPVKFIICWTKDGKATGGTGQALRIAKDKNIRIFNLKNGYEEFATYMKGDLLFNDTDIR